MNIVTAQAITTATSPGCYAPAAGQPARPRGLPRVSGARRLPPLADTDELLSEVNSGLARPRRCGLSAGGEVAHGARQRTRGARGTVVVANGEEGEPASIKDRWLLRNRPHLVLDGLRLAAAIVGADQRLRLCVRTGIGAQRRNRIGRTRPIRSAASSRLVTVQSGYMAGEETAAVRMINGGPAKPTDKPPRPFQAGVGGQPTLVSNVETLANLPYLQRHGSAMFRSQGSRCRRVPSWPPLPAPGDLRFSTKSRTAYRSPNCLPCTVFRLTRCGGAIGGYFAGLLNRACWKRIWTTRRCDGSAAVWAAVRSR